MSDIIVIGPDGTRFSFPEGTDRETMRAAMRRRYSGENARTREMIMTSQLPDPELQGVRDYLGRQQLVDDIRTGRQAAELEAATGPENVTKERFYTAAQGQTLGAAPLLQGAVNVPIAAVMYPFLTEEEKAGRDFGQFVSEMSSLGYDQARGSIARAREKRPLESAGIELGAGFLTGKTVYDELGKRFLANRTGARGAAVGAGAGGQYGFLESEGDVGQGAQGALIGAPLGAGLAKTFEAAAEPLGRMLNRERPLVLGPEDEVLTLTNEVPADYFSAQVSAQERAMLLGQDIPEPGPVRERPTGPEPAPMAAEDIPPAPDMSGARLTPDEIAMLLRGGDDIKASGFGFAPRQIRTEPFNDPRLTPSENKAVEMRRNGLTVREMADEMDTSEDAVYKFIQTAKAKGVDVGEQSKNRIRDSVLELASKRIPQSAIAQRLGISPNNVKVILANARKAAGDNVPDWLRPRALAGGIAEIPGGSDAMNAFVGGAVGSLGPAETDEERLRNIAIGAGLGGGSRVIDKIVRPSAAKPMGFGGLQAAAVRVGGKTYTGRNHGEAVEAARAAGKDVQDINKVAGFVDQSGKFYPRDSEEALMAALASGQISDPARRRVIEAKLRKGERVVLTSDMLKLEDAPMPVEKAMRAELPGSPEYEAAVAKGLDMSTPARMARAKEMGFDTETVLYHGTKNDIEAFRRGAGGDRGPGIYFSTETGVPTLYAQGDGANILPVYARGRLANSQQFSDAVRAAEQGGARGHDAYIEAVATLERAGFDGIRDGGVVSIFDPANIRSVHAAFDPGKRKSSDLLAAAPFLVGGAGLGATANQEDR